MTKQFTALVLLLEQDGKVRIEDPVSKYLPDTPAAWAKITLANLLGHTLGIPNFTNEKDFDDWAANRHTHAEEQSWNLCRVRAGRSHHWCCTRTEIIQRRSGEVSRWRG